MTIKKVLKNARKLIQKGWCQGREKKVIGTKNHYCAVGALNESAPREDLRNNAYNHLNIVCRSISGTGNGIVSYNDKKGTDKRRVLRLFDKAIKRLK